MKEMRKEMKGGFDEMRERFDIIDNNLSLMVNLTLLKFAHIDEKYKSDFNKRLTVQIVKFVKYLGKNVSVVESKKTKLFI